MVLLGGGGGGRIATTTEATSKEGGAWGKHGFPHGSEPKARDAHAAALNAAPASCADRNCPALSSAAAASSRIG
jgi:hypothetical protein